MTAFRSAVCGIWLVASATTLTAQQGENCRLVLDRAQTSRFVQTPRGEINRYLSGGVVAHCQGQPTTMNADSVAILSATSRIDFVGNVEFEDSAVTLTSDRSVYFLADERLEAYGNVVLVNRTNGTTLRGPNLTYWRIVPELRDSSELYATRRPVVEYRAVSDEEEPYVIRGEHIRVKAEDRIWSGGAVTIDRSDFHARGDSAELALDEGDGMLIGHAFVESADSAGFSISGRDLAFRFAEGNLDWVRSMGLAEAESTEWRVVADTLEFVLANDLVQLGLAWGDSIRPTASSTTNTIIADSLAIDTPDQLLQQIRGFGSSRATSVRDSLDTDSDWVLGDTLVATFDTTEAGQRILQQLDASGAAHALYRIFDPLLAGLPDINYSRGNRIVAQFGPDGVRQVDVFGEADGVHLQPRRQGRGNAR